MRRGKAPVRKVPPDLYYQDTTVTKFVNCLMKEGKRSLAYRIFCKALDQVKTKTGEEGIAVWRKALQNIMPVVEIKRRRVGGSTLQIPIEARPERKTFLGIQWLIHHARRRSGHSMQEKLAYEIMDAAKATGGAVDQKNRLHKMAEANKALSHLKF